MGTKSILVMAVPHSRGARGYSPSQNWCSVSVLAVWLQTGAPTSLCLPIKSAKWAQRQTLLERCLEAPRGKPTKGRWLGVTVRPSGPFHSFSSSIQTWEQ